MRLSLQLLLAATAVMSAPLPSSVPSQAPTPSQAVSPSQAPLPSSAPSGSFPALDSFLRRSAVEARTAQATGDVPVATSIGDIPSITLGGDLPATTPNVESADPNDTLQKENSPLELREAPSNANDSVPTSSLDSPATTPIVDFPAPTSNGTHSLGGDLPQGNEPLEPRVAQSNDGVPATTSNGESPSDGGLPAGGNDPNPQPQQGNGSTEQQVANAIDQIGQDITSIGQNGQIGQSADGQSQESGASAKRDTPDPSHFKPPKHNPCPLHPFLKRDGPGKEAGDHKGGGHCNF